MIFKIKSNLLSRCEIFYIPWFLLSTELIFLPIVSIPFTIAKTFISPRILLKHFILQVQNCLHTHITHAIFIPQAASILLTNKAHIVVKRKPEQFLPAMRPFDFSTIFLLFRHTSSRQLQFFGRKFITPCTAALCGTMTNYGARLSRRVKNGASQSGRNNEK